MSRTSITRKTAFVTIALGLAALAPATMPAAAFEITVAQLSCPAGTHSGYEGKYCWPNRPRACPAGTHLGYEGKYCWPDR